MRKNLIYILITLFFFIPIYTNAEADIKSTSIIGNSSVTIGEEITQNVYINFNGVEKNNQDSIGIWLVAFELIYDEKVLELIEVKSTDWLSYAAKEGNTWAVASVLYDDFTESNMCIDKETFCGSYSIELKFKAISNNATTTEISIGEIEALGSNMGEDNELSITGTSNSTKTITINKKEASSTNNDNEDDKDKKDEEKEEEKNESNNTYIKSSNRYLEKIEIENYEIDFNKYTNEYDLLVEENITSLKITALPENEKAKVTIIGADNFSKFNNKIEIVVVAENGMKNTYIINVKVKMNEEKLDEELTKDDDKENKEKFKLTKEHILIGGIIVGAILLILIIRIIIVKINDNKIDKALDDL